MRTVIVGGGFAGVKAALELSKKQLGKITLISDEPYFLHHATLYATATGRQTRESVIDLKDVFSTHHDVEVVHDSMQTIDPVTREVVGKAGRYGYDTLIIAIGMVTTYFGIDGMAQHSYGIKTLEEVRRFNRHIHHEIASDKELDKNYVIIGAGPTGVELAGALRQYLDDIARAHHVRRNELTITLVEAAERVLPKASKTASRKVTERLKKLGVAVRTDQAITALGKKFVTVAGQKISTETVVWTSGVANNPFFAQHPELFTLAPNGRVLVDNYLEAAPNIYVLGDNAATKHAGIARTALGDARFIADHLTRKEIGARPRIYRSKRHSTNLPVGDTWAYVEKYGIYVAGRTGYWLRRLIELRGYRALLPPNQAKSAWRAHYVPSGNCQLCAQIMIREL